MSVTTAAAAESQRDPGDLVLRCVKAMMSKDSTMTLGAAMSQCMNKFGTEELKRDPRDLIMKAMQMMQRQQQ